ncbi:hypothetical protein BCR43DRAFT_519798 [Syncephalastrum racemosum]|uniref:LIM zinc-binding domain-containing protein n=1 Tax=Syncephalastrum racemosum TaxID=13706 RepID=A0A1X2HSG9_SYNRA|nr:hypothetical protein BCR43DRAFT_519798 [Syncephalastrum racemosum]
MGYCNRCGEISTAGKCRKCGGRPVASIATSGLGDGGTAVLIADRWQNQYANSILGFDTPAQKTPSPTRCSRIYEGVGKPRPLSVQNTCANCSRILRHDTPSYLEEEAHYCGPCHIDVFSAGNCATCKRPVFKKRDPFVDHASQVWHKECFRCYGCLAPLGDEPMVDLKKRPCCEPCLMAQSGEAKTAASSAVTGPSPRPIVGAVNHTTSTPILTRQRRNSALKRTDSQLFNYYQRSLQSPCTTPPPLTPSSPVLSVCSSTSASPVLSYSGHSRSSPSPPPPVQRPGSPAKSCYQCHESLSNKSSRVKLSTPMGERWFHYPCLRCSGCQGPFTESEFVSEGDMIYHPKCRPAPAEKVQQARRQHYPCYACNKPITDRMLKNGTRYYHSQCFRCHQCQVALPADQAFYEINNEPHCEPCSSRTPPSPITTTRSTPFRNQTAPTPPSPSPSTTSSSSILRARALPKLGGAKICPKCRQSIAIMDDAPGPRASRWHKKCLQCAVCRKQMDSGAKVIEGPTGEWLVKCRACLSSH